MRILTPTIIANNESQPSSAGALLRIHDQDATSGESLLIVSSDDSDYYFKVASNGRVHFRGNSTDGDGQIKVHLQHSGFTGAASSLIWDSSAGTNQMSIRQSEENSDLFVYAHAQSLNLAEFARTTADVTFNAQVTVNGQGSDILDLYDNAGTPANVLKVQNSGGLQLNKYGSATFTGTAAYTLAVDSSGNVIEITPTDANTTYDLASTQSGTDVDITLTGSDATTDTVTLVAGDAIVLTDDGSNNVTIATDGTSESTHIPVKNTSGSTITKGTPVYITGNVGSSDRLQIAAADASNLAKMPAIGLLETDLINNAEGFVVQGGYLRNITTDVIDGTSTSSNQTVYVKAGGGITMTKPTGSTNYIQNIAKVARVGSANSGSFIVSSILRTNDIPNLADGQVWVGSTTYPVSTDFNLQEVTDGGNTTTNAISIGHSNSPTYYIDVQNSTGGTLARFKDSDSVHTGVVIAGDVNGGWVGTDFFGNGIYYQDSIDALRIYTNNAEKMRITSTGAVGIGTTSPSAFLEIANPTYSNATVLLGRQSGYPTIQGNGTSGGQWLMLDSNGGYLALNNHVTDNVILAWGGGDVAVGTGSPLARFHVKGSGNTSATTALLVENSSGTDTFKVLNDGQAQLGSYGSGTFTGTVSKILAVESGGNIIETTLSDLSGVDGSGTANYLPKWSDSDTLTDSLAYDDGGGQFVFEGSFFTGQSVATDSTNKSIRLATKHYTNAEEPFVGLLATSTSTANIVEIGGGTTLGNAATTVSFRTASNNTTVTGTERMRINSSGNVGIGTSSPSNKLNVDSGVTSDIAKFENNNGYMVLGYTSGLGSLDLAASQNFRIRQGSETPFYISSSSNVGIGTTSPSSKLEVSGVMPTAGIPLVQFNETSNSARDGIYLDYTGTTNSAVYSLKITDATKTHIAVRGDGNVGVGTSSPSSLLHLNSSSGHTITSTYTGQETYEFQHGTSGFYVKKDNVLFTGFTQNHDLSVYNTSGVEYARFDGSSSNVGIGTTTPSAKTHIVGAGNTTSTTALLVESNNGTDRLRVTDGSEVFVNASTLHYGADVASTTLGYKEFLTDVDYGTLNTGAISVYTSESTRDTIMCDYKIYDGTNIRVGTVTATTDGTSVDYTDIRKAEVGDTSDMYFYAQLSGSNLQLIFYRGSAGYDAKYIIKNF